MIDFSRIKQAAHGFTMIELLVAATIIVVLSAIGLVSFSSALKNARDGRRQADLQQVRASLEQYRSATGAYPAVQSWANMMSALYPTYLSTSTLNDPTNDGSHYYGYTDNNTSGKQYTIKAQTMETAGSWGVAGSTLTINNP